MKKPGHATERDVSWPSRALNDSRGPAAFSALRRIARAVFSRRPRWRHWSVLLLFSRTPLPRYPIAGRRRRSRCRRNNGDSARAGPPSRGGARRQKAPSPLARGPFSSVRDTRRASPPSCCIRSSPCRVPVVLPFLRFLRASKTYSRVRYPYVDFRAVLVVYRSVGERTKRKKIKYIEHHPYRLTHPRTFGSG